MSKPFSVKGVNPATGRIVDMRIVAETALNAKAKAEEAGLKFVVATPETQEPRPTLDEAGN